MTCSLWPVNVLIVKPLFIFQIIIVLSLEQLALDESWFIIARKLISEVESVNVLIVLPLVTFRSVLNNHKKHKLMNHLVILLNLVCPVSVLIVKPLVKFQIFIVLFKEPSGSTSKDQT